jgi:hypothetical protein
MSRNFIPKTAEGIVCSKMWESPIHDCFLDDTTKLVCNVDRWSNTRSRDMGCLELNVVDLHKPVRKAFNFDAFVKPNRFHPVTNIVSRSSEERPGICSLHVRVVYS